VAHLGLPDTVDTAKALLETVGIPRQVVVHHQVGPLQVDTLAGGISSDQHLDILILGEERLGLSAFLPAHGAVNGDHRFRPADQHSDAVLEIVQRVAVLGEDDQLAAVAVGVEHLRLVLQ